jgi:hypothetical protein
VSRCWMLCWVALVLWCQRVSRCWRRVESEPGLASGLEEQRSMWRVWTRAGMPTSPQTPRTLHRPAEPGIIELVMTRDLARARAAGALVSARCSARHTKVYGETPPALGVTCEVCGCCGCPERRAPEAR